MKTNDIIVISGPSGSGKSTLIRQLLAEFPGIHFSVSHTTRSRRESEIDGRDYHFITEDQFKEMIANNEFVEWAEVHSQRYGTSWSEIRETTAAGTTVLLDIDTQGARNIETKLPESLLIFIVPPSLEELRLRLVKREKGRDDDVNQRLEAAIAELRQYPLYDYIVINEKLEEAFSVLKSIYVSHLNSQKKKASFVEAILGEKK